MNQNKYQKYHLAGGHKDADSSEQQKANVRMSPPFGQNSHPCPSPTPPSPSLQDKYFLDRKIWQK